MLNRVRFDPGKDISSIPHPNELLHNNGTGSEGVDQSGVSSELPSGNRYNNGVYLGNSKVQDAAETGKR